MSDRTRELDAGGPLRGELIAPSQRGEGGSLFKSAEDLRGADRAKALIRNWLTNLKPKTQQAYLGDIRRFAAFLAEMSRTEVTVEAAVLELIDDTRSKAKQLLTAYQAWLNVRPSAHDPAEHVRQAAKSRYMNAVKSLLAAAEENNLIEWTVRFKVPEAIGYKDTSGPPDEDVMKVLAHYEAAIIGPDEDAVLAALRDYCMVMLMLTSGLRRFEVVSLDVEHVDFGEKVVWLLGKGRDDREAQPISATTVSLLGRYLVARAAAVGADGPLFVCLDRMHYGQRLSDWSVYDMLVRLKGRLQIPKLKAHGLRHKFVTEVARERGLLEAAAAARHKDTKVTMVYVDNKREIAAAAVDLVDRKYRPKKVEP